MYGFYLSCPSATFALQDGCFVPREWLAAKGLFKSTFETLLNGLLEDRRKWGLVEERGAGGRRGGGIGVPDERPLDERERTRNKLNPHIASSLGFKRGPQRFHLYSTYICFPCTLTLSFLGKTKIVYHTTVPEFQACIIINLTFLKNYFLRAFERKGQCLSFYCLIN